MRRPSSSDGWGDRTLLEHALKPFEASARVGTIVVVLPENLASSPPSGLQALETPLRIVAGGERRQDSVAAGVDAVAGETDLVLVHDAARPFCPPTLIDRTLDAALETGAAVPALRATDTVKRAATREGRLVVDATLPRDHIYLAQTPQAFRIDVLLEAVALGRSGVDATDEACLAELLRARGESRRGRPGQFQGDHHPADLRRAADRVGRTVGSAPRRSPGWGWDTTCIALPPGGR